MNAAGFLSRTRDGRLPFNKHSIDEMLCNKSYTGVIDFKGREIPGKHPALISRELFDEVQTIRVARRNHQLVGNRGRTIYLMAGVAHCAGCGQPMRVLYHIKKNGRKILYYRCTTNEKRNGSCPYSGAWLNEDELMPQIADVIRQCNLPKNWMEQLNGMLSDAARSAPQKVSDSENAQLRKTLEQLEELRDPDVLTEEEYKFKCEAVKAKLKRTKSPQLQSIVSAAGILKTMHDAWELANAEERRDMLRAIFEKIVCNPSTRRIVSLKPKASFKLLFKQIDGLLSQDDEFQIVESSSHAD